MKESWEILKILFEVEKKFQNGGTKNSKIKKSLNFDFLNFVQKINKNHIKLAPYPKYSSLPPVLTIFLKKFLLNQRLFVCCCLLCYGLFTPPICNDDSGSCYICEYTYNHDGNNNIKCAEANQLDLTCTELFNFFLFSSISSLCCCPCLTHI